MNDLRIVIVSWNVEKLLGRCLLSLPEACERLSWDVVVVDNASSDRSVETAKLVGGELGLPLRIISNADNRGFAKACNQGIAGHDSRYVLLLNPDTVCPPDSLRALVSAADVRPAAGIIGPKLLDKDGHVHAGVRRLPTVWNQLGVLLKLHRIFPWLPTFRRYFARDMDMNAAQDVDQVEGSCFLMRREFVDALGGLDERYFLWFEEVDACKTAHMAGWKVSSVPSVAITHLGGQSFGQRLTLERQRDFNASMLAYFKKWHPGWRSTLLRIAQGPSLALAWTVDVCRRPLWAWLPWMAAILAVELTSVATVFWPVPRAVATVIAGLIMLSVALRRPSIGLAVLLLELAIGSKGALLKIPNGWDVDGGTSLRIILVASFLVGWMLNATAYWSRRRQRLSATLRRELTGRWPWIVLCVLTVWAALRGLWLQNDAVVADANAWGYLILLIPIIDIASRDSERLLRHAGNAFVAALLWLPAKTLALLYVWSHGIASLSKPLYLWVRRSGIAEVTLVTGNLFRVFIQSQIYAIGGLLASAAHLVDGTRDRTRALAFLIAIGSSVSLLIGLSRSMWIGLFAGCIMLAVSAWFGRDTLRRLGKFLVFGVAAMVCGFAFIGAVVAFPYPHVDVGSLTTLFSSRSGVTDAAAESRWNLLPVLGDKIMEAPLLGSGFGATVMYASKDPRILAKDPAGMYTTYAFEWGWLDHWIKFGILGIPVMLWLLLSIIQRVWSTDGDRWLRAGFISSLVALGVLHVFTPYLNHPLGFGFLLAAEGWITAKRTSPRSSASSPPAGP
ncbi:glycosyltransferase [Patescibacteria group bacterium]|nr:glycosyltransferase [Patescibacteria group bacterium]